MTIRDEAAQAVRSGKLENQIMEVRALTRNVRISPEKARHVSRLIQGKSAVEALAIVELSPRKAAGLLGDTLRSAVANAENNLDVNRKELTSAALKRRTSSIIRALAMPWGRWWKAPSLWAMEWHTPKNALAKAIPAMQAAWAIFSLARGSLGPLS